MVQGVLIKKNKLLHTITITILSICMCKPVVGIAQSADPSLNSIQSRIQVILYANYQPDSTALSKLCRRACVFVKFKAIHGKIADIAFSKDTCTLVTHALKQAINALQNDAKLMDLLSKSKKTILQPFMYYYQAGCGFQKNTSLSVDQDTSKQAQDGSYYETRDKMEFFGATLWDMLDFSDGKVRFLDCLLLEPMQVASGDME